MAVADLQKFKDLLKDVKSALVILPTEPTLDIVASGLSLSLALKKKGISSVVSSPNPMTVEFNRLIGVEQIREDLGDKNLVISFGDYPAEDVERVAYNIENGQFTLTVVPKADKVAPKEDQILVNYSGIGADLVIVVGANYPTDLGKFAEIKEILEQPNLALLSNSPLSGWPRAIELIDPSVPSISEVVMDIVEQSELPLDEDVSTNLFLGLEDGTKNFTIPSVTADTFQKAASLLQRGAQRNTPSQPQRPQFPKKSPNQQAEHIEPTAFRDSSNIG
jgi:nanoRNase/pAp phosphatase (c-di-AMP/oligoRNAs hydrolase)